MDQSQFPHYPELDSHDNLKLIIDRKRPQLQRVNINLESS